MSDLTVEEIAQRLERPWQCAVCETRNGELFLCLTCYKIVCHKHNDHETHWIEPCECWVRYDNALGRDVTVYCDVHKNAHRMLKALEAIRRGELYYHVSNEDRYSAQSATAIDNLDNAIRLQRLEWYAVDEAAIREVHAVLVAARGFDSEGGVSKDEV